MGVTPNIFWQTKQLFQEGSTKYCVVRAEMPDEMDLESNPGTARLQQCDP